MRTYSLEVEADILLARVLELPPAQQLRFHEALDEMLGERLGVETERAKQVRARRDAVRAIREVATHLGLPQGRAPSVAEFKRAAREMTLSLGFQTVYAAFDKRWELAQRFYEGMPIPLTAAQRKVRRQGSRSRQDLVVGLQRWWIEVSPGREAMPIDYNRWAVEQNEGKQAGWKHLVERPTNIVTRLEISWPEAIALACGETTVEEAQQRTKEVHQREAGPLITQRRVRQMLGLPLRGRAVSESGFPNPVARLYERQWWRVTDVQAWIEGKRDFTHTEDAEQHIYMDLHSVARAIGLDPAMVREQLRKGVTGTGTFIPRLAGKDGRWLYWERVEVESKQRALQGRRERSLISLKQPTRANGPRKTSRRP